MIGEMLRGIDVELGKAYDPNSPMITKNILYTGPLDSLFDYQFGPLEYRSLYWQWEHHDSDFQGCATMNYTAESVPYTRIIEYRHFMQKPPDNSITAREYPQAWQPGRPMYYPVGNEENNQRAMFYKMRARKAGLHTGGRLADYKYYDMHQVIAAARVHVRRLSDGS
jgi:UDP-galactopyranose mutase